MTKNGRKHKKRNSHTKSERSHASSSPRASHSTAPSQPPPTSNTTKQHSPQSPAGSLPLKILIRIFDFAQLPSSLSPESVRSALSLQAGRRGEGAVCVAWRLAQIERGTHIFIHNEKQLNSVLKLVKRDNGFAERVKVLEVLWVERGDFVLDRVAQILAFAKAVEEIKLRSPEMGEEAKGDESPVDLPRILNALKGLKALKVAVFDFDGLVRIDKLAGALKSMPALKKLDMPRVGLSAPLTPAVLSSASLPRLASLAIAVENRAGLELLAALLAASKISINTLSITYTPPTVSGKDLSPLLEIVAGRLRSLTLLNDEPKGGGRVNHKTGYLTPLLPSMTTLESLDVGLTEVNEHELDEAFGNCSSLTALTLRVNSAEEAKAISPQTVNDLIAYCPGTLRHLTLQVSSSWFVDKRTWAPVLPRLARFAKGSRIELKFVESEEHPTERDMDELRECGLLGEGDGDLSELDEDDVGHVFAHMMFGMMGGGR